MNREYFRLSGKVFVKDDDGLRIVEDSENIESNLKTKNINDMLERREPVSQMQSPDDSYTQTKCNNITTDLIDRFERGEKISKEEAYVILDYYINNMDKVIAQRFKILQKNHKKGFRLVTTLFKFFGIMEFVFAILLTGIIVLLSENMFYYLLSISPAIYSLIVGLIIPFIGGLGCIGYESCLPIIDKIAARKSLNKDITTLKDALSIPDENLKSHISDDDILEDEGEKRKEQVADEDIDDFLVEVYQFLVDLESLETEDKGIIIKIEDIIEKYKEAKKISEDSAATSVERFEALTTIDYCFAEFNRISHRVNAASKNQANLKVLRQIRAELDRLKISGDVEDDATVEESQKILSIGKKTEKHELRRLS